MKSTLQFIVFSFIAAILSGCIIPAYRTTLNDEPSQIKKNGKNAIKSRSSKFYGKWAEFWYGLNESDLYDSEGITQQFFIDIQCVDREFTKKANELATIATLGGVPTLAEHHYNVYTDIYINTNTYFGTYLFYASTSELVGAVSLLTSDAFSKVKKNYSAGLYNFIQSRLSNDQHPTPDKPESVLVLDKDLDIYNSFKSGAIKSIDKYLSANENINRPNGELDNSPFWALCRSKLDKPIHLLMKSGKLDHYKNTPLHALYYINDRNRASILQREFPSAGLSKNRFSLTPPEMAEVPAMEAHLRFYVEKAWDNRDTQIPMSKDLKFDLESERKNVKQNKNIAACAISNILIHNGDPGRYLNEFIRCDLDLSIAEMLLERYGDVSDVNMFYNSGNAHYSAIGSRVAEKRGYKKVFKRL